MDHLADCRQLRAASSPFSPAPISGKDPGQEVLVSVRKISHIGVAVSDLERSIRLYRDVLGLELMDVEEVPDQKVRVALFRVGESRVELLGATSPQSPVAKFLERHGEGVHHVAYEVEDLGSTLQALQGQGVELIDKTPRVGAGGMRIAFVHPRGLSGVLTELCEPGGETPS
jgi:methylmalonyl-CoA/ethylmalonyl-CoA epimerase